MAVELLSDIAELLVPAWSQLVAQHLCLRYWCIGFAPFVSKQEVYCATWTQIKLTAEPPHPTAAATKS
jgi:hypothetical protein